jgi:ribosomal protein S14
MAIAVKALPPTRHIFHGRGVCKSCGTDALGIRIGTDLAQPVMLCRICLDRALFTTHLSSAICIGCGTYTIGASTGQRHLCWSCCHALRGHEIVVALRQSR